MDTNTGDRSLRSEHRNLTLSTTKRGPDLGTLVVPFDPNIPPVTNIQGIVCILINETHKGGAKC